jgi:hypothetical protein
MIPLSSADQNHQGIANVKARRSAAIHIQGTFSAN